jgi:O-antigen/teichoic acid export membrane protein
MTSGFGSLLGFVSWIIIARIYNASEVGLAAAIISSTSLLGTFSKLGFDFSVIRYLPIENDKKGLINSSQTIVGIFSLILALIFVAGLQWWAPALLLIQRNIAFLALFIVFTAVFSLSNLQYSIYIGLRSGKYSLYESLISSVLSIPLPIIFASLGALGIFLSSGLASLVAFAIGLFVLIPRLVIGYFPKPTINKKIIFPIMHFSVGNYIAEILDSLPGLLFPLIIINYLTTQINAYFFIVWTIANTIFTVPVAISTSLLVEGSYEPQQFQKDIKKAIKFTFLLIIPITIIIFFFGGNILLLFGKKYSQGGVQLLQILVLSSIPLSINRIYITIKRIQEQIRPIIFVYLCNTIFTLSATFVLLPRIGLLAIGIAWITTQTLIAIILGILIIRNNNE